MSNNNTNFNPSQLNIHYPGTTIQSPAQNIKKRPDLSTQIAGWSKFVEKCFASDAAFAQGFKKRGFDRHVVNLFSILASPTKRGIIFPQGLDTSTIERIIEITKKSGLFSTQSFAYYKTPYPFSGILFEACKAGNSAFAISLIKSGFPISGNDVRYALENNFQDVFEAIRDNSNEFFCDNTSSKVRDNITLLEWALLDKQFDLIPKILDSIPESTKQAYVTFDALLYACGSNNEDMIRLILQSGAPVANEEETSLHMLGYWEYDHDKCGPIAKIILDNIPIDQRKEFVNRTNSKGESALHLACEHRNGSLARTLIEAGGDVLKTDDIQQTPLHHAANWNAKKAMKKLIENIPENQLQMFVNLPSNVGNTALHELCQREDSDDSDFENMFTSIQTLIRAGTNIHLLNSKQKTAYEMIGTTRCLPAFFLCLSQSQRQLLSDYIGFLFLADATTSTQTTATNSTHTRRKQVELHEAVLKLDYERIDEIEDDNWDEYINSQTEEGDTALHLICKHAIGGKDRMKGEVETADILLYTQGVALSITNNEGLTPMQVAVLSGADHIFGRFFNNLPKGKLNLLRDFMISLLKQSGKV